MGHKDCVICLSEGIGDALLFLPLISELRKHFERVDGYFLQHPTYQLFSGLKLVDNCVLGKNTIRDLRSLVGYDCYFSDYLLSNYFVISSMISRAPIYIQKGNGKRPLIEKFIFNAVWVELNKTDHLSIQKSRLYNFQSGKMAFPSVRQTFEYVPNSISQIIQRKYVIVQTMSGNSKETYKSWSAENWDQLIIKLSVLRQDIDWVLVGDRNEIVTLSSEKFSNVKNMIGKTSIPEVYSIVSRADFYLGCDSGLMHLAFAFGVPTISIWGPTCQRSFGYQDLCPSKNESISLNLSCSPCVSPIRQNKTRVIDYRDCPDKACLNDLGVDFVFRKICSFMERIEI